MYSVQNLLHCLLCFGFQFLEMSIGFSELFREGQLVVATTYKAFQVYIAVALVYLVLTTLSSIAFKWLEVYMNPVGRAKKQTA